MRHSSPDIFSVWSRCEETLSLDKSSTLRLRLDIRCPELAERGLGATELADKAQQTFENAVSKIRPLAAAVIGSLRELKDSPEQVSVEFGIKLSAASGVVIASTAIEANFKITATWKSERC